ncbi:TnsA endonuclease C-terminal domain-containing protein [Clostridium sp. ZBS14]|uniref:TnsA endonuclease C-terminal domain-containing protein n=1 Tax=Clostridium sp. ZBS14 TaxID=2949970 RepID=UPI00207A9BC7|nr:TnsA endonuclease C-terminal domain-containing protein [Clostridium sp. ZBS14]
MAKRRYEWSDKKLERYLKEGRGQGEGKDYKSWLTIQDFPSMGRCSRLLGWKSKRVHQLFSDIETRFFYLMDWEDSVIDIRECFPLLDLEDEVTDTDDLRLDIFKDKETGEPYVLTTSFLITLNENGKLRYIARSVKLASELDQNVSVEKYEILRRYWQSKGIDWGIVTQKEIPVTKAKNIEWVHSSLYSTEERGFLENEVIELQDLLLDSMLDSDQAIRLIMSRFDKDYNLESGSALFLFKHMIATKKIIVDMDKEIDINATGKDVILEIRNRLERYLSVSS